MKISCNSISKVFGSRVVLNSFSHDFNDAGFYLLFGESGSGKTTFLNILSGFLPFEGGSVTFDGMVFNERVDNEKIKNIFEYITQDPFFADFLTVMDNLRMISHEERRIKSLLDQFGLGDKAEQMPTTLSGGEKQRLAIIRALISNKKVLFLDEPTAALDLDNKLAIFELLTKLKESVLIICSSHDALAADYADEVITFTKETARPSDINLSHISAPQSLEAKPQKVTDKARVKNISPYLKKWFVSSRRNRWPSMFFVLFLALTLCVTFFLDTPQNKTDTSVEKLYRLNMLTVSSEDKTHWRDICPDENGVRAVMLNYTYSCPTGTENMTSTDTDMITTTVSHETNMAVLPFDKEVFKFADKVKHGTYYTAENQIILSAEMAEGMAGDKPETLLGTHITKKVYGLGAIDFEIVGIFDYFNEFEKTYMNAMMADITTGRMYSPENHRNLFFINSKITDKLEDNDGFYLGPASQRVYNVFFDSFGDMKAYYEKYGDEMNIKRKADTYYLNSDDMLYGLFEMLMVVLAPVAASLALFTVLFFVTLKKTEFIYSSRFISVFEYAGYSKKSVLGRLILLNIKELIKHYIVAFILAFAGTYAFNEYNNVHAVINYQVFSYNPLMILGFLLFLLLCAVVMVNIVFRRVRTASWYENLILSRDLI